MYSSLPVISKTYYLTPAFHHLYKFFKQKPENKTSNTWFSYKSNYKNNYMLVAMRWELYLLQEMSMIK